MNGTKARRYFEEGYLCAESVLLAGAEKIGIDNPAIPAMATGFCSGLSRSKGPCGALMGAVLLINLTCGRDSSAKEPEHCYELVQLLSQWFEQKFESRNCYEITGCDFLEDMDRIRFKDEEIKGKVCYPLVEETTEYVITLLKNNY